MTDQREAMFVDTSEGESIMLLLGAAEEGCKAAIQVMSDFPERFEDPVLREEARRVSAKAIQEFGQTIARANAQRLALRVKQ